MEWDGVASEGVGIFLARTDANRRVDAVDEDLAVADLTGAGGCGDRLDHLIDEVRIDRDFDLQLGQKAHRIFCAPIDFGMAFLSAVALHFRHRQPVHANGGERVAHLLEFERLYHCHYYFHVPHPSLAVPRGMNERPLPARWRLGARKSPRSGAS